MNSTSGCAGKIGYPTRTSADRVNTQLRGKPGGRGKLHAYHCDKCGAFHLGRSIYEGRRDRVAKGAFDRAAARYAELTAKT